MYVNFTVKEIHEFECPTLGVSVLYPADMLVPISTHDWLAFTKISVFFLIISRQKQRQYINDFFHTPSHSAPMNHPTFWRYMFRATDNAVCILQYICSLLQFVRRLRCVETCSGVLCSDSSMQHRRINLQRGQSIPLHDKRLLSVHPAHFTLR